MNSMDRHDDIPRHPAVPEPTIGRVEVLGVRLSVFRSYDHAFEAVLNLIQRGASYVTVNNVHTVTEAARHPEYRRILNGASVLLADGKPLSVIGSLRGAKGMERIFGPTFMEHAIARTAGTGVSHYFFGGDPRTLERMRTVVEARYPGTVIAGMESPPFRPFTPEENAAFLLRINDSGAGFIWVGLGAPKQERWMADNAGRLRAGVLIGIGAGFKYLSGDTHHAPAWMKESSLEWLYRLVQEPRRLWKRYLVTNSLFLLFILLESLRIVRFRSSGDRTSF